MSTITFNVTSSSKPSITVNHLKYALYKDSDLTTIVTSQSFAPAHPQRTVTFPGLARDNYRFRLLEVLPDDVTIVRELLYTDFTPGNDSIIYYEPIEIQADVTVGLVHGTTSFTFDGTAGTFDWRNRTISVERVGQGTMQAAVQYLWVPATGVFTLLTVGDTFQSNELFVVSFGLIVGSSGGVPPTVGVSLFKSTRIITGNTTLTSADIGKNIIMKGLSNYFQINLPDITTCPDSIITWFESGIGNHDCIRIATSGGQTIDWLKGARTDMKIGRCESFGIYKEVSTSQWRIHQADGNFRTVGRFIYTDADLTKEFNCLLCDGSLVPVTSGARLYEDFVQQLPPAQVCNYIDHGTGTNKYKFSYASGGSFFLPDLRNLYLRNSDGSNIPGDFHDQMYKAHGHGIATSNGPASGNNTADPVRATGTGSVASTQGIEWVSGGDTLTIRKSGGTETRPVSRITKVYVLI